MVPDNGKDLKNIYRKNFLKEKPADYEKWILQTWEKIFQKVDDKVLLANVLHEKDLNSPCIHTIGSKKYVYINVFKSPFRIDLFLALLYVIIHTQHKKKFFLE